MDLRRLLGAEGVDCVLVMTEEIEQIKERDDERFKLICDTMPQLVWTATPDGLHDFFNTRWYTYTGLKPEDCLGHMWQSPFHPDDIPEALTRWNHSLRTGEPYQVEYRCRNKSGEWRWFLGRALAVRSKETGEIEKWFGKSIELSEETKEQKELTLVPQERAPMSTRVWRQSSPRNALDSNY